MKTLIILAALIAVSYGAATICPMVVCESLDSGCLSSTKTDDTWEVKIQKCDSNQYCNITYSDILDAANSKTASCKDVKEEEEKEEEEAEAVTDMYPGYPCTKGSECASDKCGDNGCTGASSGDTCVDFSMTDTKANNAKMCGDGLYCDSDNKCAEGKDAGDACTATKQCSGRAICSGSKCVAPGGLETDDACTSDYYCPTDDFCSSLVCKAATAYSTGSYGAACSANDDCSGDCNCVLVNTKGEGNCGLLSNGTKGKAAINTERTNFKGASFNCPLAYDKTTDTVCASSYESVGADALSTGSCYKDFIASTGALVTESTGSAYGLYASIFGFIAYLLA